MKRIFLVAILIIIPLLISGQNRIHLDENDTIISEGYFQKKWRSENLNLIRWDSIGKNGKRYCKLSKGLYQRGNLDYKVVKKNLEDCISSRIPDSVNILLIYAYKDDLCNINSDNVWTRNEINRNKGNLNSIKKELRKNGTVLYKLFENGIELQNKKNKTKEYFFLDRSNYFLKNIFTKKTICGSTALLKPNGQVLVRNGEGSIGIILEYSKPDVWSSFFNNH